MGCSHGWYPLLNRPLLWDRVGLESWLYRALTVCQVRLQVNLGRSGKDLMITGVCIFCKKLFQ